MHQKPLLEVKNLKTYFPVYQGILKRKIGDVKAVDDVSFHISEHETFGLVGESGCGKTTVGKSIVRLVPATGGEVCFEGRDLLSLPRDDMRSERKNIQMVFQDPYGSLNPRMDVLAVLTEPMLLHGICTKAQAKDRALELLDTVGLSSRDLYKYPHEFSGGQRQRIVIARALAVNPKLIVCDEPVSALDVSIQAQILNLFHDLQQKLGVSYLFIAHGMAVVRHISHRVGVMYLGHLVETAPSSEIFTHCIHPYTRALMSSVPLADPHHKQEYTPISGELPSPLHPPKGCKFHPRCPYAKDICQEEEPILREVGPGHQVACHFCESFHVG